MAHDASHESPEVGTRKVLAFVFSFLALVVLLFGGLRLYYHAITRAEKLTEPLRQFPAPQLQPNPTLDYRNFEAAQRQQLTGYAWTDRAKSLVHLPIDRAMALVVARGAAGYDPVEGAIPAGDLARSAAPLDGAPRAVPAQAVAPYGEVR